MNVLVVESPAKAKTINKYLGPGYKVLASFGHIRDLPSKDGSVKPDQDFSMVWEVDARAQSKIKDIASAVKGADKLILATDPDREGEAISWHILEVLREKHVLGKMPVERVVFNAITKSAILDAIAHPREINSELVDAYLARRALDYLVGFTLSPVLWRKLPGARSAGRVQSVALRLVVEREAEIEAFKAQEYWGIDADLAAKAGNFTARLTHLDGKKLEKLSLGTKAEADRAVAAIEAQKFAVGSVESKPVKRNPWPPRASWASPPSAPCRWRSPYMKARISAGRPSASSPICAPTASPWRRKRSAKRARPSAENTASVMCRPRRGSMSARRRTRRKPMRPFARPASPAPRKKSPNMSAPTTPGFTN